MDLTLDQLKSLYNKAPAQRLEQYQPALSHALAVAGINTAQRLAAFLAQVGHESQELHYMSEVWGPTPTQLRYDPPTLLAAKLGNIYPGDGYRFRGAGPIQVTGRANFRAAGNALGLDLENHPEMAFTSAVGFELATWFWTSRGLNEAADQLVLDPRTDAHNFDRITLKINGGLNGKPERDAYYSRACQIFHQV